MEDDAMILLVSALLALQADPVPTDAVVTAVRALRTCIDREVVYLERSGEAANIVAEAAKTSCDGERATVAMHAAERGSTPEGGQLIAERVLAELDEQVRSRAVLQVARIRADRNRP